MAAIDVPVNLDSNLPITFCSHNEPLKIDMLMTESSEGIYTKIFAEAY